MWALAVGLLSLFSVKSKFLVALERIFESEDSGKGLKCKQWTQKRGPSDKDIVG